MHDPKLGTVLTGVKEQIVMNPEQVIALLQGGEAHRHVGHTDMNEKSSRAHTLFKLIVESKEIRANKGKSSGPVRVSTLNLIDLAGSENAKMAKTTGDRAREGKYINQSLLTLSTIIQRLSEEKSGAQKQHLPYRDSKLTRFAAVIVCWCILYLFRLLRILQAPLSGNAMICIICTISPGLRCAEESHNTLKFASRAKKITVDARVNETFDDKALLRKYREEIEELKAKLAEMESMVRENSRLDASKAAEDGLDEDEKDNANIVLQVLIALSFELLKL
jgi:centromeric protein E